MRALMIGFGNVGRQIARILTVEKDSFERLDLQNLSVTGITTGSHGSLANPEGIDLSNALAEFEGTGAFTPMNPDFVPIDSRVAARRLDYDVLVELSTLSISDRGEPAAEFIRTALSRGKHVVSANKGPLAFHWEELQSLARQEDCRLLFESTVLDGAPVFNLYRHSLRGCRVLQVSGVVNSTTNYVLGQLEAGISMEEAVHQAQQKGFAEADPSLDLEGWDAAAKITVLANALMQGRITPLDVDRMGITDLSRDDLDRTGDRGCRLKLVARAQWTADRLQASVRPEELAVDHPLARISGSGSALIIETDLMGPLIIEQLAPDLYDTAYGVLNDLLELTD
ncbi:MAG: homoserine dehydrogenase [Acidobacteriota bacterium]|nr:MAG: homoserine dehydrogenase [Acidobacteriota bacterium]